MRRRPVLALLMVAAVACVPPEGGPDEDDVAGFWQLGSATIEAAELVPARGHRVTLRLGSDGTLGGSAGCNSYSGTYDLVGGVFAMGPELAMTAVECAPEVMAVEDRFLRGLRLIESVTVSEGSIELAGGETRLVFEALPPLDPATLAGRWRVAAVGDGAGETEAGGDAFVEFSSGGTMTGDTGCRRLEGRFQVRGDEVLMTEMEATGECPGAARAQDGAVIEVLGDGFRVEGTARGLRLVSAGDVYLVLEAD